MDKQTWDEWAKQHQTLVCSHLMIYLPAAKMLWDRATKAEMERDENSEALTNECKESAGWKNVAHNRLVEYRELTKVQDKAQARIAELEAAQAKDRESYASTKLHNIALRDELIAIRTPRGEQPKSLEITDEMVEVVAKATYLHVYPDSGDWEDLLPIMRQAWRSNVRAALEAVKDQLVVACPGCAEKAERITAIEEQRDYWKHHAELRFDRMEKERIRANRLELDCDVKVERITELGFDALAMETEMSQARRRIEALEATLRKSLDKFNHPHNKSVILEAMADHSITLPDPEQESEPMKPEGTCSDCPDNCPSSCDTCGDTAICPRV